jgi:hypothetical protein
MSPESKTIALVLYPGLAHWTSVLQVLNALERFAPEYKTVFVAVRRPMGSDLPMQMIADATFGEVPHP